ncbi:hypothetical protein QL285_024965 [Trifolium repens]|nr:hypothetical protein QL285_024965 [Trifolium repens]
MSSGKQGLKLALIVFHRSNLLEVGEFSQWIIAHGRYERYMATFLEACPFYSGFFFDLIIIAPLLLNDRRLANPTLSSAILWFIKNLSQRLSHPNGSPVPS